MDTNKLPPDTAFVWHKLNGHPALKGFVLVGGTALTLRIAHRISEDLDFAYPAVRLPLGQINALFRATQSADFRFVLNQNILADEEFINSGMELKNYQQDYIVNDRVKLTFFAPDGESAKVLQGDLNARMRIASLDEIFAMKCLVCADRSKTRDWFDLYILMTAHGYTIEDLYGVFYRLDCLPKFDIVSSRLRNGRPAVDDEGYEQLAASAPTVEDMCRYFTERLDYLEVLLAKEAFHRH